MPDSRIAAKVVKSIYGLRQSGKYWFLDVRSKLLNFGFKQSADPCLFFRIEGRSMILVALFVDDFSVGGNNSAEVAKLFKYLQTFYKIKDLGSIQTFIGMDVEKGDGVFYLSQETHIDELLKKYDMTDHPGSRTPMAMNHQLNPITEGEAEADNHTYRSAVGAMLYIMICTRPDISYAVGMLSRFNHKANYKHWSAAKKLMRYLKQTKHYKLQIGSKHDRDKGAPTLIGYCDSN